MRMKISNQALLAVGLVAIALHLRPDPPALGGGGVKHVVIVEETADKRAKHALAYVPLQDDAELQRRAAKGVVLDILDKDTKNENGTLVVPPADIEGLTLPAILFYAKRNGKLLYRESLGEQFTADTVVATMKRHGA